MLRSHEVLERPVPVDFSQSQQIPLPDAWRSHLDEPTIEILPLVEKPSRSYRDGWCTYAYEHSQAPELEVICGGINSKTPEAAALWRQGHLLHFGFEQSPAEMNDNGRALLVNSICYISRFTEDRPLVRTPSSSYSKRRLVERRMIGRRIERNPTDLDAYFEWFLAGNARDAARRKRPSELAAWYSEIRGFLRPDERGDYVIDEQAREFGVNIDSPKFIPSAIAAWKKSGNRDGIAQQLLSRYAPYGPSAESSPEEWQAWWSHNRPYLFFSDTGGCCWLIDPLAEKRQIPTSVLRGPLRATLPAITLVEG